MQIHAPLNTEALPLLQQIEISTAFQLPAFHIIGLPGVEVSEARERIRSAIEASGIDFPKRRVILNLSPASIRKRGTGLDFAMALAVLFCEDPRSLLIGAWGELGLDGKVKSTGQMTRSLYAAWQGKLEYFFLAEADYPIACEVLAEIARAKIMKGNPPQLVPVKSLKEAWHFLSPEILPISANTTYEMKNIKGPEINQKCSDHLFPLSPALERMVGTISSGSHHCLLLGPKGVGKSHLMEWLITLKPFLPPDVRLEQRLMLELRGAAQSSLSQEMDPATLDVNFGVRRVSSQVRPEALIGRLTPSSVNPGEFSLAHGGILIADEFPEWDRDSREILREPLERGMITLSRAGRSIELLAQFQFAGNGNLCPCGGMPPEIPLAQVNLPRCQCNYAVRRKYIAKLSGPILDRMDLVCVIHQQPSSVKRLKKGESDNRKTILMERVEQARQALVQTWGKSPGHLSGVEVDTILADNPAWDGEWMTQNANLSLRSRHKVGRVALTLAAWDQQAQPSEAHFMEAVAYRYDSLLTRL